MALLLILFLPTAATLAAEDAPLNPAKPLPEAQPLLQRMLERSRHDRRDRKDFDAHHTYTRIRIREERSPKGELRSRTVDRKEHPPSSAPSGTPDQDHPAPAGSKGRAYEERDIPVTREILDRFKFHVSGRETLQGQPVVRIEFEPRAGELPGHRLVDRFINRTAGTLWLIEPDGTLVQAQLRLLEEVSFFGGIAGVVHTLQGTLSRAQSPDGAWYTRASQWHVDYREFLVRKVVSIDETTELHSTKPAPTQNLTSQSGGR